MSANFGTFTRRQPKNARSRRVLKNMAPKIVENSKKILFLKGQRTSQVINDIMNDMGNITKPFGKKLKKKNAFAPFEGLQHIEFLCFKNDCSLFCFGSDAKKRPNNLIMGRLFDFKLLDMMEFGVDAYDKLEVGEASEMTTASFGSRPVFVFQGSEFESDPFFERTRSLVLDFFRGTAVSELNLDGLDRVVFVSLKSRGGRDAVIAPSDDIRNSMPQKEKGNAVLRFRHYGLLPPSAATGGKLKLVDVGPNVDLEIRRVYFCPTTDMKRACRVPKEALNLTKGMHENVSSDALGNLRGQIHVGKQDLGELALRRFKANKVISKTRRKQARGEGADGGGDGDGDDDATSPRQPPQRRISANPAADGGDGERSAKKRRTRNKGGADGEAEVVVDI